MDIGMNNFVNSIACDTANNVYAGGAFTEAGGAPISRIARWNGSVWQGLGSGCGNTVESVAVHGGRLLAGGAFISAGGSPTSEFAIADIFNSRWDFNGDDKSDIIADDTATKRGWQYLMDGATPKYTNHIYTISNNNWGVDGMADFNGDYYTDLLWRDVSTNQTIVYLMNAGTVVGTGTVYQANSDWKAVQLGDFNGDGKVDILREHVIYNTGYIDIMNGTKIASSTYLYTRSSSWSIMKVADFNGDRKADILWEKSDGTGYMYIMDGGKISSHGQVYMRNYSNWSIKLYADFNGDRKMDILWQHALTGVGYVYLMDGMTITPDSGYVYTVTQPAWEIKGAGDINADGNADLIWQNSSSGQGVAYIISGRTIESSAQIYVSTNPNWETRLTDLDFNGDGKADLFWQNLSTLKAMDFLMNGLSVSATGTVYGSGTKLPIFQCLSHP